MRKTGFPRGRHIRRRTRRLVAIPSRAQLAIDPRVDTAQTPEHLMKDRSDQSRRRTRRLLAHFDEIISAELEQHGCLACNDGRRPRCRIDAEHLADNGARLESRHFVLGTVLARNDSLVVR